MLANLFICHTPLQALIAQHLIKQQNRPSHLLMFTYPQANNPKFQHYYQSTAQLCSHAQYHIISSHPLKRFFQLPHLINKLDKCYHTIFVSSIDNPNAQYPISKLKFQYLETFDDGTANLLPDSVLYRNPNNYKRWLFKTLRNIKYQTEELRQLAQCHHTLYPNLPNIVYPTLPITLWHTSHPQNKHTQKHTHRILLGQPTMPNAQHNAQLTEQILQHFAIQSYFPHPREQITPKHTNIIDTPYIFEDWLCQQRHNQPDTHYHIYHFASTAAINVHNFPNASIQAIRPNYPPFNQPLFNQLYQLMQKLSIPIIHYSE